MLKFAKAVERKERYSASSIESYHIEGRGKQMIYRKTSTEQSGKDDDTTSVSSIPGSANVSRNNSFHRDSNDSPRSPTDDEISPTRELFTIRNFPREPFDFHRNRSYSSISEEDIDALNNIDCNKNVIISNVKLTKRKPNKNENPRKIHGRKCFVVRKQPNKTKKSTTDTSSTEFNYGKLEFHKPIDGYTAESTDLNSLDVFENYAFASPHYPSPYDSSIATTEDENNTPKRGSNKKEKKNSKNRKVLELKNPISFKDKILSPIMPRKFLRSSTVGTNDKPKKEKGLMRRSATDGNIKVNTPEQQHDPNQGSFRRFCDMRQNIRRSSKKRSGRRSGGSSKSSSIKSNDSYDEDDNISILTTVSSAFTDEDDAIFKVQNPNMSPMTYSDRSFSGDSEFQDFDAERLNRILFRRQRFHYYQRNRLNNASNLIDRTHSSSPGSSADSQYGGSCSSLSASSLQFSPSTDISTLPDRLLLLIFTYLSTRDVCTVSQVCKKWHSLYLSGELWNKIEITDFNSLDIDSTMNMILQRLAYNTSCLNIQQIKLDGCVRLTDTGLKTIASRCPELRAFEIASCLQITPEGVFHILKNCPNMIYLNLSKCDDLTGFSLHFDSQSKIYDKTFEELRYLDISSCSLLTDDDLAAILRCVVSLEYLYLRRCDCISDIGLQVVADYCPNLKEVSMNDCVNITDNGVVKLIQNCPYLRYVSLAKCPITNKVLEEISASRNTYLRHLNLYDCEFITDTGIMKLSAACPRLRSLDIGKCMQLTDASLYGLSRCVLLRRLNLKCCMRVTDAGIRKLATTCRTLRHLDLRGCTFSSETILYIQRHCSLCTIEKLSVHFC